MARRSAAYRLFLTRLREARQAAGLIQADIAVGGCWALAELSSVNCFCTYPITMGGSTLVMGLSSS